MSDEAAAPPPKEKSALEKEMEALLGAAGDLGTGAKKAQGEAAKVRRKSKDLEESLDKMAESSDMWKDLGGGGDASQSCIWSGTAQIDPECHGTRRPRPPAAALWQCLGAGARGGGVTISVAASAAASSQPRASTIADTLLDLLYDKPEPPPQLELARNASRLVASHSRSIQAVGAGGYLGPRGVGDDE